MYIYIQDNITEKTKLNHHSELTGGMFLGDTLICLWGITS